ncbi:MAG: hypothetical protein PHD67_01535 [Oscillospiraceae bacterium]|nr:hypothetical protein [Oscillospiraceae bacterium]
MADDIIGASRLWYHNRVDMVVFDLYGWPAGMADGGVLAVVTCKAAAFDFDYAGHGNGRQNKEVRYGKTDLVAAAHVSCADGPVRGAGCLFTVCEYLSILY